jgi:hypothetical protein
MHLNFYDIIRVLLLLKKKTGKIRKRTFELCKTKNDTSDTHFVTLVASDCICTLKSIRS